MNRFFLVLMILGVIFMSACSSSKKIVYVKDMNPDSVYLTMPKPKLKIQRGDRLSIVVRSKLPELSVPFNMDMGLYDVSGKGEQKVPQGAIKNYLVNETGTINFPILGDLHVEGLTLEEIKNKVYQEIERENLINNPLVHVELLNLRINVMGEVRNQRLVEVPDGRITLLDALSEAGGLTVNGAADKVVVIREEGGERKIIYNDLESSDLFASPAYYLQQNDVVYVQPRTKQITPGEQTAFRYTSLGMSIASLALTLLVFLK